MSENESRSIDSDQLRQAINLYERGLYLQAYSFLRIWGPPQTWYGSEALVFAGRLVVHLGALRLSDWLFRRAWRENPSNPEAQYFYAYILGRKRGSYTALQWMNQRPVLHGDPTRDIQASWYALHGTAYGILRDFDTAEYWYHRANEMAPQNPWVKVCQAHLLELEDKYEEALKATSYALEIQPFYRPAIQSLAHLLTLLDRDEEALELLSDASQRLESSAIVSQLYVLQLELKLYAAARKSLERFVELSPLADKYTLKWIATQQSEMAYREGDIESAIHQAKISDSDFLKTVSGYLEDASRTDRLSVLLPVGFVRQHHMTCAPATLSAISRYWSMPADHLQVADEICYNGTSSYSERKWAQENGWVAREFTVTETSAVGLLDRGIPFTFTTVDPSNAHLQAIIGYDGRRGTLVVRDPFWRHSSEAIAKNILNRYKAWGPRGMALVPERYREQLESVDLPDAHLWDQLYELDRALTEHQRTKAQDIYDHIQSTAPGHLLVCHARRRLSLYDCNPTEQLAAVERLLEYAADDQVLQLERLGLLRDLAHREERLETYKILCGRKETHRIFWQQYAGEMQADARRHDDAIWLLQRAVHRWPTEATNYFILANIYWDQRKFDEAFQLYRYAACLDDKNESFANAYFMASIWGKQTDLTLNFLRNRFERFGKKSSLPARTLFSAYLRLDRTTEAFNVVEQALIKRPDDGDLLLFAADACLKCSSENMARAVELLKQAEGKCPPGEWFRIAAKIATSDGRLSDALAYWQKVLEIQPLAVDAYTAVTHLLAETQGLAKAYAHLEQATDRFPHHYPLHELRIQWVHDEPSEVREKVIRKAIAATPDNAYFHRELALLLADRRCFKEAWRQMEIAGQLDPTNTYRYSTQAYLFRAEGKIDQAKKSLRNAILLSVDNSAAITELVRVCESADERRSVLAFVKEQLIAQVIFGDGLLEFRAHAREAFPPEEVLALLREGLKARPDLWHAWSAVINQLLDMKELEEANQLAREATERFPLLPVLWLERASVCRARGENDVELEALETAYQINSSWGVAVRALCEWHNRRGDYIQSKRLLERATARTPLDIPDHILLAETLWRLEERESAVDRIHHAVQLNPGYKHAWDLLNEWTNQLGCPERALETARELTRQRPGELRSWMILARSLDAPEQLDERLQVLDKVVDLNPQYYEAYDLRAQSLANAGRWTEAKLACSPPAWGDTPPVMLRARAAWIESKQGNLESAIDRMREVVKEDPYFFDAWLWLAEWYSQTERCADCLSAAEMMVSLYPHSEIGYGCLGEAKLLCGDRAGAMEAFRHAFEINPNYEFAGEYLFDLQLAGGDLSSATETISLLRTHINNAFVVAREIQLAARQKAKDAAADALTRACSMQCESSWPVTASVKAMVDAGWRNDVKRILESLLDKENIHPEVGTQWIKLCTARGNWQCSDRLPELIKRGEIGLQATQAYIEAFKESSSASKFSSFVKANWDWLRANTFTWGSVSYALIAVGDHELSAKWHADWRERPDANPWMLLNVAEGFRALNRDAEASDVSRNALSRTQEEFKPHHHIWLAYDEICTGNIVSAKQHLEKTGKVKLNTQYRFLVTIMECVVKIAEASPEESDQVFYRVNLLLKHARFIYGTYGSDPARRRVYRRCLAEVAKYRKGVAAGLWYRHNWIRSYLYLPGGTWLSGPSPEDTKKQFNPPRTGFSWWWIFIAIILTNSIFNSVLNNQNRSNLYQDQTPAEVSNADIQYNLGLAYEMGKGVKQDDSLAAIWYRRAADHDHANAQYNLATMYETGKGVSQNYAEAAEWYRKAADQGNAYAQCNLGVLYEQGKGVIRDNAKAAEWYRKAANQGDAAAQYNLGLLYASGEGVVQDYVHAYMWLSLSATSGEWNKEDAEIYLDVVIGKMNSQQLEQAKRLTREWKPTSVKQ